MKEKHHITLLNQKNKKGKIASGLCQELTVTFEPQEYKLYISKIIIITELGKVVIPIEAYPVLNPRICIEFHKTIDFPQTIVNTPVVIKKTITSVSEAFFDFEFILSKWPWQKN